MQAASDYLTIPEWHATSHALATPRISTEISCRRICDLDVPAIIDLLREGFPDRTRAYWQEALRHLLIFAAQQEAACLGHVLISRHQLVGAILLISCKGSGRYDGRQNLSSWYVKPAYRAYAPLLIARAIRDRAVTYVNISPAKRTLPIIEAQGFVLAAAGCFVGVPAMSPPRRGIVIRSDPDAWSQAGGISVEDERLLRDHAMLGCVCFWLETAERGYPFIFRRRILRLGRLPCAMLLYCPSLEHLEAFAGPIGRALARRGLPLMLAGTERPLRGVPGKYFPDKMPIYYKGAAKPRGSDLSYTEAALFGI